MRWKSDLGDDSAQQKVGPSLGSRTHSESVCLFKTC